MMFVVFSSREEVSNVKESEKICLVFHCSARELKTKVKSKKKEIRKSFLEKSRAQAKFRCEKCSSKITQKES